MEHSSLWPTLEEQQQSRRRATSSAKSSQDILAEGSQGSKGGIIPYGENRRNKSKASSAGDTGAAREFDSSGADGSDTDPEMQRRGIALPSPKKASWVKKFTSQFRSGGALEPFRLLKSDFKGRFRIYQTDWFFNQLILASAVYVFFTNLLPGITFSSDLYALTGSNWGTIEVVLSTGICGVIFALFSAQPLTILGVTGPFCILSERIYDLCKNEFHVPFLPFMAWSCIHATWMHWLLAIFNAHDWTMKYVTVFSTEIFALLNSVIYFHKAIQEIQRAKDNTSFASFLYSIIGCIGTFLVAVTLASAPGWKPLFHKYVRMLLSEYAAAISIVIFIGLPHVGDLKNLDQERLPVSTTFRPTSEDRSVFFVKFWQLDVSYIFGAVIPGAIITTLYFFDVEVSTICATGPRYNIRKPGGYAWDVLLLGCTTGLCGILGIPPANGLLPQAPLHSESLRHAERVYDNENKDGSYRIVYRVHEQRWSHLLHALGILAFTSPPFMKLLGLTPTSVLAGLFLYMGEQSLSTNPILYRVGDILTPVKELPALPDTIHGYRNIHLYTIFQIVVTGVIFGVTFTPVAPIFPIIIVLFVPLRLRLMTKWWTKDELNHVDAWACREEQLYPDLTPTNPRIHNLAI